MRNTRAIIGLTSLVLVGLGLVDLGLRQNLRQCRRDLSSLATREARLQRQTNAAKSRRAQSVVPPAASVRATVPGRFSTLFHDPKLRAAYLAGIQAGLASKYGPFFRARHLTPDQIASFEASVLQREATRLDIAATVPSLRVTMRQPNPWAPLEIYFPSGQVTDPDAQAALDLLQEADQTLEASQRVLLGPDGYWQLQQYQRAAAVRPLVDDLVAESAGTTTPLSADLADQLTQVLADGAPSNQKSGEPVSDSGLNWDLILPRAQTLLTPAQFSILKEIAAPDQWKERILPLLTAATGH